MAKKLNIGAVARWTGTPILTFVNGTPESIDLAQWVYNPRGFNLTYTVASGSLGEVSLVGSVVSFDGSGPQSSTPVSFNISDGSRTKESPQTSVVILNQPIVEPAVPVNVQADGLTQDTIRVIWTPGVGGPTPTSFPVYRSLTQNGTYTQIAEPASSPYDDSGFPASTTRWYKVSAKANGIESAQSTADAGTTLAEPAEDSWPTNTPSYQPIIPGIASFGANQFAGSGRHPTSGSHTVNQTYVMYVDRLSTANVGGSSFGSTDNALNTAERIGYGSVRWCIERSLGTAVSRIVVPLVSGVIDYNHSPEYIRVGTFVTLAWQTAPQPGLFLRDSMLYSGAVSTGGAQVGQNLLWHVPIFHSETPTEPAQSQSAQGYTCIANDVLYANCMIAFQQDEGFIAAVGTGFPASRVGYWQCLVLEPVADTVSTNTGHGFFFDPTSNDISMIRCATLRAHQRSPLCRTVGNISVLNHLWAVYDDQNSGGTAVDLKGSGTQINVEQGLLVRAPTAVSQKRPIYREPGLWDTSTSLLYGDRIRQLYTPWNESDWVWSLGVSVATDPLATSRITAAYPAGYVPFDLGAVGSSGSSDHRAEFGNLLLDYVGPRPTQRIPTFQQSVTQTKNLIAQNGGDYGFYMHTLSQVAARMPTVSQTTISNPYAAQAEWGGRSVPTVSASRDVPYTSGTFSDGKSRVGYTRMEEFIYELHLDVMP